MSDQAEIEEFLLGAGVETRLIGPLARYGAMVLDSNRQFNLTGAKTAATFAPHLVDSLSVVPYLSESLVDIGSGAGLPAIPAAIATGISVTMIETTVKKGRFLQRVMEEFALSGQVVIDRAEVAAHDERLRGRFQTGTARAVSGGSTVAELLLPFLQPGGLAVLQRGLMDTRESDALADASTMLGGHVEQIVPLDGERKIVLVRKDAATQIRFPRRTGVPEKRPLCT